MYTAHKLRENIQSVVLMFNKQQREKTKELEDKIKSLEQRLRQRLDSYYDVLEGFKQTQAEKWEYMQVKDISPTDLSQLGNTGWELVAVTPFHVTEGGGFFSGTAPVNMLHLLYTFKRKTPQVPTELMTQLNEEYKDIPKLKETIANLKTEKLLNS